MTITIPVPFGEERQRWLDATVARLDPARLQRLLFGLTDIHSPTGATRAASEFMASTLRTIGMDARYLPMNDRSGNVLAERRGSGGGAAVMLYAPIDTHLEGNEDDQPWVGPPGFVDLAPRAQASGDWVYGLGASNPKGMIATLVEVATALIEAEVPLVGDLLVGLADGGMPVNIAARDNAGMSSGVHHLLARGAAADFAIIMKPWNFVYHEEPGMGWFKLRVLGSYGYAGVPRGTPGFRSSILPAARIIPELEQWLIDYADRNMSGVVKPHGWIAGIRSGSVERPSFPSAVTEIFFDVRINPRTSPAEVKAQFARFVADCRARHPDIELEWEMYGSVPGGTTDPDNWIIQSARRGWEAVEGRPHPEPDPLGGQTDGAALRRFGVPTARIGWPWPAAGSPEPVAEGLGGMGATFIPDLMPCARKIAYALIDTLTRTRAELGLTKQ
ncbi:M20 family metallopeptidase [Rhizorhabdus histidinilytica]|jgi:acetylornithine deacetylase/succinyl-diaminopimelate desuccinylase-like protein|uniref:Acetylornithine deacetylase/Succinyl-diaminopimelate desuccinylase n=1 Tax=Rhizorhabdus histidinilytica TaxID=439228 RepID=A0A1T5D107_9SPHN|nr:acetylornithine deacetylase [Rhizorhabdus histidinilytica]QEH79179.1 acetylornithine deacetylase [Sphingomonas sp. C8-2]SKB65317.1 Acetylornithine deacetylase/Succinyl-diaminopimelate desuccinylase [Rhizorhabdus histidinilytica]